MINARKAAALMLAVTMFSAVLCGCSKKSDVPDGMIEVESEYTDFRFFVPDNWTPDISNGFVSARASDGSNVSVQTLDTSGIYASEDGYVIKIGEESYVGVSGYFDNCFFAQIKSTFAGVELKEEYTQNQSLGSNAYACKYVYDITVDGTVYTVMQILAPMSGKIIVLTYTATAELYSSHLSELTEITDNFLFN